MGAIGFRRAGHESARVVMHPDATVTVFSGGHSHGQGHATSLAQIAADALGRAPGDITVIQGDTESVPFGTGTYNSRTMAVGGTAVHIAAGRIASKLARIAAVKLRARPRDLVLEDGAFTVRRTAGARVASGGRRVEERVKSGLFAHQSGLGALPSTRGAYRVTLVDAAAEAHLGHDLPLGMAPGLDETEFLDPRDMPTSRATHVVLVEVDPSTGHVGLLRHVVVDDCGTVINPLLATGQVHGGAAQGIGQALMEHASYDDAGVPPTSLMEYAVPRAGDLPTFTTAHSVTPTSLNPRSWPEAANGPWWSSAPALSRRAVWSPRGFR